METFEWIVPKGHANFTRVDVGGLQPRHGVPHEGSTVRALKIRKLNQPNLRRGAPLGKAGKGHRLRRDGWALFSMPHTSRRRSSGSCLSRECAQFSEHHVL